MRNKVTRQCPKITTFEEKGEPNALPLGCAGLGVAKNTWLCVAKDTGASLVQSLVWLKTRGFVWLKILELA